MSMEGERAEKEKDGQIKPGQWSEEVYIVSLLPPRPDASAQNNICSTCNVLPTQHMKANIKMFASY